MVRMAPGLSIDRINDVSRDSRTHVYPSMDAHFSSFFHDFLVFSIRFSMRSRRIVRIRLHVILRLEKSKLNRQTVVQTVFLGGFGMRKVEKYHHVITTSCCG